MRAWLIFCAGLAFASPLWAQTAEQEAEEAKTYLEELLQDNLSGEDHTVTISGFRGALSSQATLQRMTVADEDGVWLTMQGATLNWSRSALLSGRLEVAELSATEITVERLPKTQEGLSTDDAEASDFALPDLPVSINVEKIAVDKVTLGKPVLGEALTLTTNGRFVLDEGNGSAELEIRRLDRNDVFSLAAGFSNSTRILALDLNAKEDQGGLISRLIGIPGEPSLALQVTGEAPVSDYTARLALSSDGQRRFGGTVRLAALSDEAELGHEFTADLNGDVRPLFQPEMHPFFGESSTLQVDGTRFSDGRTVLDKFQLSSGAMNIEGTLALAAEGLPDRFELRGRIGSGEAVRLPLTGPETTLNSAEITARYDAGRGESWIATAQVFGLSREGLRIAGARIDAEGQIKSRPLQNVSADIRFDVTGLSHDNPSLAEALGEQMSGKARLGWVPDAPLELRDVEIVSADVTLQAEADIAGLETGLQTDGTARLSIGDLRRFAALAGRDIAGAATGELEGRITPLSGEFDLQITAETEELRVAHPRIDPVLRGASRLSVMAARDTTGTTLRRLTVRNDAVSAEASGRLQSNAGQLDLTADLREIALVEPRLDGPARIESAFGWTREGGITIDRLTATVAETLVEASGQIRPDSPGLPAEGELSLNTPDLSRFSQIAGRALAGSGQARLSGSLRELGQIFDAVLDVDMRGLRVDHPRIDPLLAGQTSLNLDARRDGTTGEIRSLSLESGVVSARASGAYDGETGRLTLDADIADAALVEPSLSGPASVEGSADWSEATGLVINRLNARVAGAQLSAEGTLHPERPELPVSGSLTLSAEDLSRFASLAGRPIAGNIELSVDGAAEIRGNMIDATGSFSGSSFRSGIAELDRLIAGTVSANVSGSLGQGAPNLRYLKLTSPQLKINASGEGPGAPIAMSARLADLAVFAPDFPGPATARGTLTIRDEAARNLGVALDATGPAGTSARITGDILEYGRRLALDIVGRAPLGLANRFITPNSVQGEASFDLRIDGPPGLNALSGELGFAGARVALPRLNYALNDLTGAVQLAVGRATIDVAGNAGTGGTFRATGPIQLIPGFPGNLRIELANLGLVDPALYQTTVGGTLEVSGNLVGGAAVAGELSLGPTTLRVPSGNGSIAGTLPDMSHFFEPADVRQTRARAGLIETMRKSGAAYPIDILVRAPNRIFVRGRGLDAELGGRVRLGGTTADVTASGVFELIRGRLDLLGKRLELTEGLIDLRGALDPYLRFVAETESDDILIQMVLEGLASEPTVTFTSSPELPQEEVVARLLFGRDLASMSAFQAAQLVSAVATLSGKYQGGITGRVRKELGLSDLDVTTTAEGTTQFTAGAYISDNVYSEVTADSEGKQEINLKLDLSKTVTVKGSVNNEGNSGIGIFFEKDY